MISSQSLFEADLIFLFFKIFPFFESEKDYKNMLLTHYSFLKRPVLKIGNKLFIGNTKKVVNNASEYLMNFNRY